jgi:hypothetical protein
MSQPLFLPILFETKLAGCSQVKIETKQNFPLLNFILWIEDEVNRKFRQHQNNLAAFFLFSKPNIFPSSVHHVTASSFCGFHSKQSLVDVHIKIEPTKNFLILNFMVWMKDEVSSTLRHHDCGRVDVGAGDQGENARICHPEHI